MQPVDSNEFVFERVARIRPTSVRADRAPESSRVVIVVQEVVVATRVGSQRGVIPLRGERQWRAAPPAPDDLGGKQFLLLRAGSLCAQVLAQRRHVLVEFAKGGIGAVAAQYLGLRHRG